jgi:hypothetical protein
MAPSEAARRGASSAAYGMGCPRRVEAAERGGPVGWPEAEAVAVRRAVVVWRAMPVRSVVAVACFNFFL